MKFVAPCFAFGVWLAYATVRPEETKPTPTPNPAPSDPSAAPSNPSAAPSDPAPSNPAPSDPAPQDPPSSGEPTVPATTPPVVVEPESTGAAVPPDLVEREKEAARILSEATSGATFDAPLSKDERVALLKDVLGATAEDLLAFEVLDEDVAKLRRTLVSIVGQGESTKDELTSIPTFDDELERIGIKGDVADAIRELYPQVQALRGELILFDKRTGKSSADFQPVEPSAATAVGTSAQSGEVGAGSAAAAPKPRPRTNHPQLEATLCFHSGDVAGALEILMKLPGSELGPREIYVLGASLVATRRYGEARNVLEPLARGVGGQTLSEAAQRQLARMDLLEAGLVGLDPLSKAAEEHKR